MNIHKSIKTLFGIIPIFVLCSLLLSYGGCTTSSGRDSGGTIWGTVRSVDNPDDGITDALLSLDDRNVFAITSGTGYFSLMGIPEGQYDVTITKYGHELYKGAAQLNRNLASIDGFSAMGRSGGFSHLIEFPTAQPGNQVLAGTVLDPEGKPVVGAEVNVIYSTPGHFYVKDTDTAGSFYFEKLQPIPDLLIIDADGFRPAVFASNDIASFMVAGNKGALDNLIPLEPDVPQGTLTPGSIVGKIANETGMSLTDIKVAILPVVKDVAPINSIAKIKSTADGGAYAFENIEPGVYLVWAGGPNYFPSQKQVTLKEGETLTIDLILEEASNRKVHPFFRR